MKKLFKDITDGLVKQGYKIHGGNDTNFLILSKDGNNIKVHASPSRKGVLPHLIVRYF